jgi:hypothetical protein
MAVQCPFCGTDWAESAFRVDFLPLLEAYECDCGAWWYEGMEDVLSEDDKKCLAAGIYGRASEESGEDD